MYVALQQVSGWCEACATLSPANRQASDPETILEKAARFTRQEFEVMPKCSASGERLLLQMHFPPEVTTMVYHHHERCVKCGSPDGLRFDDISLGARIIALVGAFEAMTTPRP